MQGCIEQVLGGLKSPNSYIQGDVCIWEPSWVQTKDSLPERPERRSPRAQQGIPKHRALQAS